MAGFSEEVRSRVGTLRTSDLEDGAVATPGSPSDCRTRPSCPWMHGGCPGPRKKCGPWSARWGRLSRRRCGGHDWSSSARRTRLSILGCTAVVQVPGRSVVPGGHAADVGSRRRSGQPNAGQPGWLRGALVRQRGPRRMCACRLRPRGWALRGIVAGLQRCGGHARVTIGLRTRPSCPWMHGGWPGPQRKCGPLWARCGHRIVKT
ncbi:uncharacterized protein LOC123790751 [Ursus americanus]|uniref:uncharacterized protein LOC123790751 n=1 Tax=Ursus americanus TaxID=9643 RepID=UPI001E67AF84|nr:uncharacterized protein LOC123790751 [Ursus americanus]